jgi:hypothetical protein
MSLRLKGKRKKLREEYPWAWRLTSFERDRRTFRDLIESHYAFLNRASSLGSTIPVIFYRCPFACWR